MCKNIIIAENVDFFLYYLRKIDIHIEKIYTKWKDI